MLRSDWLRTPKSSKKIIEDPPIFIYCSAEQALEERFLSALKDRHRKLHQRVAAIVVDESHTVEAWTGKRKSKGKAPKSPAFTEAYGQLSILRSMCKEADYRIFLKAPPSAMSNTADSIERGLKGALIQNDWGKKPPVLKVKKQGRQRKDKRFD
ncbi:hypothetical protein P5673_013116 [Acropora cervicornis]|uniref:Uncharacterized protein n=1 Tax=Acropora cervicornis TaxID=6130 RepID=A0AAD9V6T7_ACRCE|nr:hypothetical protein P5673_013116 [Acropora cervicornis]